MSTVSVYSFADATGLTTYVDSVGDFIFTGPWSSSGTYMASPLMAAQYGAGLYMCIRDNVGDNPLRAPTRSRPTSWSILSLLYEYQAGGTNSPSEQVALDAYALAESGTNIAWAAYELAQIGTNTGSAAYNLAGSAFTAASTAVATANGAFSIAVGAQATADSAYALAQIGTNTGTAALTLATSGSNLAWTAFVLASAAGTSSSAQANAAYALAQIGTNTGTAAYSLAQTGSNLAWAAYELAQVGTSAGSALVVANAAYAMAQIGTNTGTAAYDLANLAYQTAISASGSAAGTVALDAYHLAESGTNLARAAYLLAQIGTNTGTAAYNLAGSIFNSIFGIGTVPMSTAVSGTIQYDLAGSAYQITTVSADLTLGVKNLPGHAVAIYLIPDGVAHTISYAGPFKWFNSPPTSITDKEVIFSFMADGAVATTVRAASASQDPVNTALNTALANSSAALVNSSAAYALAQIGTNTGSTAYSVAQAAYSLAQIGTVPHVSTIGTVPVSSAVSGTLHYSFTGSDYWETTVTSNVWISGSNMSAGREMAVILIPDGTAHTLGYDAFKWFGTTPPGTITSGEIIFTFLAKDTTIANTMACFITQA